MTEKPSTPPAQELAIEIDDATAVGAYSNLALVSHSETEFVIDFIFHTPQPPKAKVRSRVVTSPLHLKRLVAALQDNLAKYEARFGPIKNPGPANGGPGGKVGFYH